MQMLLVSWISSVVGDLLRGFVVKKKKKKIECGLILKKKHWLQSSS